MFAFLLWKKLRTAAAVQLEEDDQDKVLTGINNQSFLNNGFIGGYSTSTIFGGAVSVVCLSCPLCYPLQNRNLSISPFFLSWRALVVYDSSCSILLHLQRAAEAR